MMKSIIICEGETDFTLLQYFMIKVHGWKDSGNYTFKPEIKDIVSRDFIKESNMLTIISSGGCTNIKDVFSAVIRHNENTVFDNERFSKVVIITDNDEEGTEEKMVSELNQVCNSSGEVHNRKWSTLSFSNMSTNQSFTMDFLLLVIPFDENGALETFLLDSISKQDSYDAEIIKKGNDFVDIADSESKYLKHRSLRTKAKFDVYFSIRTPAKQFRMRQDILKNVPWEDYENIRKVFKELNKLG